ncbi:glycine cleavage system aminomethyltransferase GcvT [Geomonas subterranea]|uniref:aminomethyltransferase n=1 Tax=Geomonas subterranea TaxID=2847989 RepID=A0ABX8LDV8_9BACT|nr:glycine cleavage system aminomethyltransferase GcvT [Geomonas subterranea]QXE89614.1 glycine cleavage system aminomethyltransferase GcvT [Geomonas subterranea]QXM08270.1 glycine cleavage system aminomethyltransferase GcvT [Geomonas subterranea]
MEDLKATPLRAEHENLKALMAPFGGWLMPIQYSGIIAEHKWCREKGALFDICHMGEFLFKGDLVADGLEGVFTFPVSTIPVGRSRYGFLLNDAGGVIDDLIVFRLAGDEAMIVVNAATTGNDFAVIRSRLKNPAALTDISARTGKVDLQGPLSRAIMVEHFGEAIRDIPFFKFIKTAILGSDAIVSRTGYTGELGYEIFLPADKVPELWRLLLEDPRVAPAGLGARDLLRLEMGYSLYGNDLDETITPLTAGLSSFVNMDKEFVGKAALERELVQGSPRMKVAFKVDSRRAPRHHYRILHQGEEVGVVTSGAFSPMLSCGIGLGLVKPGAAALGTRLTIRHEKVEMEAQVVELPFYTGGSLRS